jgi:hypothetical protein
MIVVSKSNVPLSLKAYRGDAKTLLAFDLAKAKTRDLAGFTIRCAPKGQDSYFIHNTLRFEKPGDHAQVPSESANASINAPIHKFRWVHVPGSVHQGTKPFMGEYAYTVTPRYFDGHGHLLALDPAQSATLKIDVAPFGKGGLKLGFTRGYTQSQAFVHHFGKHALIRPKNKQLIFDTSQLSGKDAQGREYTFNDEYEWLGFTARERIFELLNEVLAKKTLKLDMFAYDLNEPDLMAIVLKLAAQGRVRVILDNASLHHSASAPKPEDLFEKEFVKARKKDSAILRGKFGSFAHDKVFVVYDGAGAKKVLTGSTNFSVTGLYVNSNHVLVIADRGVAKAYAGVFELAWATKTAKTKNQQSDSSKNDFPFGSSSVPKMSISFAPHEPARVQQILGDVARRIRTEGKRKNGSVLFAVMQVDISTSAVYDELKTLHENQSIFSFGISDTTSGIRLYQPGKKTGVLVTGKPSSTKLPPPFSQVPGVGRGHQIHHKFVICGFNRDDAVVYCGSSNLNEGGEKNNGDNLLEIHDADVATAFAIEALGLVDHFNFLDRFAGKTGQGKAKAAKKSKPADLSHAAAEAGWFLSTTDRWVGPYYDTNDLYCTDRKLFG